MRAQPRLQLDPTTVSVRLRIAGGTGFLYNIAPLIPMGVSRHQHSAVDFISKRLFPNIHRDRRRTHLRFLLLSLLLGLLICGLLGSLLWLMNRSF